MKTVKTVKCKLQVNIEQATILLETLGRFAAACNDILQVSLDNKTTNKVKLQHLCYHTIKDKYGLHANLVIRAIARVAEATKKKRKQSKPRRFKATSMSLDARTFLLLRSGKRFLIATINGRLKLKLDIGNFQRGLPLDRNLLLLHCVTTAEPRNSTSILLLTAKFLSAEGR